VCGYRPDMAVHLLAVTYDAHDPARLARFWGGMLRRDAIEDAGGLLLPGTPTQVGLRFVPGQPEKEHLNRLHLHLTSASLAHQLDTVAAAVALGAEHVDVGQLPEDSHIVLADPAGNHFCVIEPGNRFLSGCGFLAELACGGTRDVGLFWSEGLGWPLVWDENQETAVQSPLGGTTPSGPIFDRLRDSTTRPVPQVPAPRVPAPDMTWVPDRHVVVPGVDGTVMVPGHWEQRLSNHEVYTPPLVGRTPTGDIIHFPAGTRPPSHERQAP